jgi:diguanylate cyclase (GGDEF)-like protein
MERLLEAVQELSLARRLPEIQSIVRSVARELTGADGATFVLRDNGFCYYADEDAIAPLWKGRRFPEETCISGWVMQHRKPAVIENIYADPRIPHEAYCPTFVRSLAMVPIRTNDPIGAIGNYWADYHTPSKIDLWLLQALADSASIAIENVQVYSEVERRVDERTRDLAVAHEELERLSVTDELTGLHNRRGFYRLAHGVLAGKRKLLLVYIDIDGLKQVNDQHGHAAGDTVIRGIASALRKSFRHSDILARIGGDEFCVLVPDPVDGVGVLRSAITKRIDELTDASREHIQFSVSIGVIEASAEDGDSLDSLIARADALMYRDKQAKRAA